MRNNPELHLVGLPSYICPGEVWQADGDNRTGDPTKHLVMRPLWHEYSLPAGDARGVHNVLAPFTVPVSDGDGLVW
jgi:hypothetical protein